MRAPYVTSSLKESIEILLSELRGLTTPDGKLVFQTVSTWNNQLSRSIKGEGYDFLCPACFIEIQDRASEMWLNGISTQDLNITFHLCYQELDSMTGTLDENLNVFDYRTYIRGLFTRYDLVNCTTLQFEKEKEDFDHSNIYHYQEIFKTKYIDNSGNPYLNGTYIILPRGSWGIGATGNFVNPNSIGHGVVDTMFVI